MSMTAPIKYFTLIIISVLAFACTQQTPKAKKKGVNIHVFGEGANWGYEVYVSEKCFIRQEIIPAIQGKIPFKSQKDAELVANLVADKIRNNEIPKVEIRELTLLGINDSL